MENEVTKDGISEPPKKSGSYDAFVSYRRSDERTANAVYELLKLFGQRVFLDRRCIALGQTWESTILIAARNARTLIVLWSRSAAASVEMKRELQMVSDDCQVVPIRLDMSALPPSFPSGRRSRGLTSGRAFWREAASSWCKTS